MFGWFRNWRRKLIDDRIAIALRGELPNLMESRIRDLLMLTNKNSEPNVNNLWLIAKDIDMIKLNIKFFGYEMAQAMASRLPVHNGLTPRIVNLKSKASTQEDLESDWAAYWASELKIPIIFHRKVWELVYVLQALWENKCLERGCRGIGFGCGEEPLPSYLAAKGVSVLGTDLPPDRRESMGWASTNQHASLDKMYHPNLVGHDTFKQLVKLEYVDMNVIPGHLRDFDFCWSVCAMEHLGSISAGLQFVENVLEVLRPGGVAIHTTEFNFANDIETIDNWPTVLFQRKHLMEIAERLTRLGHTVAPLDLSAGDKILDRFVDLPPYAHDLPPGSASGWVPSASHLKLAIDGFASTCFGLLIRKRED